MTTLTMKPSGQKVPFTDISIGEPFYYEGRFWTRTDRFTGTDFKKGSGSYGACSFIVKADDEDEAVSPQEDYFLERSVGLEVERVTIIVD